MSLKTFVKRFEENVKAQGEDPVLLRECYPEYYEELFLKFFREQFGQDYDSTFFDF